MSQLNLRRSVLSLTGALGAAAGATSLRSRSRRLVAATTVSAGLALAPLVAAPPAEAINPPQTQYSGVVNILGGTASYSIRNFWATTLPSWGYRYSNPTLRYYTSPVSSACGTVTMNNSSWCSADWTIYLDYNWNQGLVNRYGDFGAGGVLAHEWAHAVDSMTRTRAGNYKDEYHADCLSGLYYRYGYAAGRLLGADYHEFYNWLYYLPYSASHGSGPTRAAWFRYGYSQYTKAACDSVYRTTTAGSAGATADRTRVGASSGTSAVPDTVKPTGAAPVAVRAVAPGELPSVRAKLTQPAPSTARR